MTPRTPKTRRPLFNFLCLLAAALSLTACGKREKPVERATRDQILIRSIGPALGDLDPHLATQAGDYNVLSSLLEGLVAEDPIDLHPVPGVAASWDISPDQRTYTFLLRTDAKWSNGEPVTAQDFVRSWKRMLTASLGAKNAQLLYVIQGAEAFHKNRTNDFSQVGVSAPDAHTLRVTLEHPTPYFLSMLNHTAWFPIHEATVAKYGPVDKPGNTWTRPGQFVGNGPFTLTDWQHGHKVTVKKSSTYWDAAHVRLNGIVFRQYENRDSEERDFRAGQLHLTDALPVSKIDTYKKEQPALLRIDPLLGTYFYRLNIGRPFLNDIRIRRALALAIDRQQIVERILRGGQQAAVALTPPGTAGYTSPASVASDPDEARRLLAEAGYPGGKGLPAFELLYNNSDTHALIAQAIQAMWHRELGVEVHLTNQENTSVLAARSTGNFQILRSEWTADYVEPSSFLEIFRSDSGNNYTGWSSTVYDQLLFQAARTSDENSRRTLLGQAETILLDQAPIIPLYHYTHVFVIQPSVRGWSPTLLDHHPYKHVYLEN